MKEENLKIGMYTENDYFELFKEHNFLGRSMCDAIFDKIHAQITEIEQLKSDLKQKEKIIEDAIEFVKRNDISIYQREYETIRYVDYETKHALLSILERK